MADSASKGRRRSQSDAVRTAPDVLGPRVVLLLCVLALTLIGFVMIYSASSITAITENTSSASYLIDQLVFAVAGVAVALVLWKVVPYRVWAGPAVYVIWGLSIVLLAATAVAGIAANGAQRWLVLMTSPITVSIQPSEFVKIALVLMAARLFSDLRRGSIDGRTFLTQVIVLVVVPVFILFITQSDLGTTAVIFVGVIAVMWLGEVPLKTIGLIVLLAVVFAIAATVFSSYRSDRFLYLDPWNDGEGGQGAGYQIAHSYYAFSEGGLFGVGLGNSHEKYLYLPESETDFIFAIIGEELGLVGAMVIIFLFLAVLWAGMRIARAAYDDFGSMIAGALTIMLVFQAFLNIGCTIGVFPTTGKPLPFISSGGSSLVASFIMVGIVLAVSKDTGAASIHERRRDNLRVVREAGAR